MTSGWAFGAGRVKGGNSGTGVKIGRIEPRGSNLSEIENPVRLQVPAPFNLAPCPPVLLSPSKSPVELK